jgi:ketosteroid isomerase-like protein
MTTGEESMVDDAAAVMRTSLLMADAIGKRDVAAIATLVTTDFVHRSPGGAATDRERFLEGIRQIPGEIVFVKLESVQIDVVGDGAIATGIQHARVRIDGQDIDDRRAFVDWFVRHDSTWKFRLAVDLPAPTEAAGA